MSIEETPWDAAVFGMPTFEIRDYAEGDLIQASRSPGHYTIRVDPLASKALLHAYGFYYCDTLIEPCCPKDKFRFHERPEFTASEGADLPELLGICSGAFSHGRFHRDFNLDPNRADQRYDRWLASLHGQGKVLGLYREQSLIGFVAHSDGKLLLHAIAAKERGKGYAKYLWSAACRQIYDGGISEISSSISASNLAVVNLYASLGFRFGKACDLYHCLVK